MRIVRHPRPPPQPPAFRRAAAAPRVGDTVAGFSESVARTSFDAVLPRLLHRLRGLAQTCVSHRDGRASCRTAESQATAGSTPRHRDRASAPRTRRREASAVIAAVLREVAPASRSSGPAPSEVSPWGRRVRSCMRVGSSVAGRLCWPDGRPHASCFGWDPGPPPRDERPGGALRTLFRRLRRRSSKPRIPPHRAGCSAADDHRVRRTRQRCSAGGGALLLRARRACSCSRRRPTPGRRADRLPGLGAGERAAPPVPWRALPRDRARDRAHDGRAVLRRHRRMEGAVRRRLRRAAGPYPFAAWWWCFASAFVCALLVWRPAADLVTRLCFRTGRSAARGGSPRASW